MDDSLTGTFFGRRHARGRISTYKRGILRHLPKVPHHVEAPSDPDLLQIYEAEFFSALKDEIFLKLPLSLRCELHPALRRRAAYEFVKEFLKNKIAEDNIGSPVYVIVYSSGAFPGEAVANEPKQLCRMLSEAGFLVDYSFAIMRSRGCVMSVSSEVTTVEIFAEDLKSSELFNVFTTFSWLQGCLPAAMSSKMTLEVREKNRVMLTDNLYMGYETPKVTPKTTPETSPPEKKEPKPADFKTTREFVLLGDAASGKSTIATQLTGPGKCSQETIASQIPGTAAEGRLRTFLSDTETFRLCCYDATSSIKDFADVISLVWHVDIIVLVLSAEPAEFEASLRGINSQYLQLARASGIPVLVALNKMDVINWSYERYRELRQRIVDFCKACTGAVIASNILLGVIPVSMNVNVIERAAMPWFTGQCLLEGLDSFAKGDPEKPFLLPFIDKLWQAGGLMLALGTLLQGRIKEGQTALCLTDEAKRVKILAVEGETCSNGCGKPGDQIIVTLMGAQEECDAWALCSPDYPLKFASELECEVDIVAPGTVISRGYKCVLHLHTQVREAEVEEVVDAVVVRTGDHALLKIKVDRSVPYSTAAFRTMGALRCSRMSGVLLRNGDVTVAFGTVN